MMDKDMAQARKSGQMELSMKVNGASTRPMVAENSGTLTVMFTRASGKMTRPMATVSTCM